MYITTNKQNSADRAQGLRYFAYFRPLGVIGMTTSNKQFIKREHGERDEVEFSYRYVGVDAKVVDILKKTLGYLNPIINRNAENSYVVILALDSRINPDDIHDFNKDLKLPSDKYGVYISFFTEYDHAGFNLPEYVREFYLKVGGQFDVSFVNI